MISKLIKISSDEIRHIIFEKSNNITLDNTLEDFKNILNNEEKEIIKTWAENETDLYFLNELKKYDESASIENYKEEYGEKYKYNMAIWLMYYII
ncbi:hypothetical protein [Clostridium botulinum]|uniref:hypothetical protein n=1 Tax=Clostridium botulinum TaxID=1491 RepID=UPI001C9B8072|nr:hypothetical protein [Clostridium botulinum]MBY6842815.1 hypothetical protein [Clostridium botulinum]